MNALTTTYPSQTRKASTVSARFEDGMLVTAEMLGAASRYPVELMQVLVRAYLGCGVVCGLQVQREDPDKVREVTDTNCPRNATFVVEVRPGVAVDCHGFPLELCDTVRLDLRPDPCACKQPSAWIIAIRHTTSRQASASACGCSRPSEDHQCAIVRDHVEIRAFDAEDEELQFCQRGEEQEGLEKCTCLTTCGERCCGESWVYLARVTIDQHGLVADTTNAATGKVTSAIDDTKRRYVKPIECGCASDTASAPTDDDLQLRLGQVEQYAAKLAEKLDAIERQLNG